MLRLQDNLLSDEEIVVEGEIHRMNYVCYYIIMGMGVFIMLIAIMVGVSENDILNAILSIMPAGILFIVGGYAGLYSLKATQIILTTKRVCAQKGVFSTSTLDAPLDKINTVSVTSNFLGYGNVKISTSSENFLLKSIAQPVMLRLAILEQIEIFKEEQMEKQAATISSMIQS